MAELPLARKLDSAFLERLGGESRLEALLIEFYERQARDILIGFFFDGRDLVDIARRQKSFLLKVMGVTHHYTGKAPQNAHRSLPPILAGHFDRRLKILQELLEEKGLSPQDVQRWVELERSFRPTIVS